MLFETSWDDGSKFDLKLADLLNAYKIPATFYMPIKCDLGMMKVKELSKEFEIGCHTFSHPQDLKLLVQNELNVEINVAKEILEIAIEKPVTKFCYPRGRYNVYVQEMVKRAGFTEARTTEVLRTEVGDDPFAKPTTIHAYQRKEYGNVDWLLLAKTKYDLAVKEDSYFHLWGHSAEIEKNGDWERLDKLLKYIHENRNS